MAAFNSADSVTMPIAIRSVNWQPISLRRSWIVRTNSRASPSRINSGVNSVAKHDDDRVALGGGPAFLGLQTHLDVVGVERRPGRRAASA